MTETESAKALRGEARLREDGFELLVTSPIGGWGACMSEGAC